MLMRQGATIVAPGFNGGTFPVPLMMMTLRDVTLTGVYTGTPANLKEFIKFYVEHKVFFYIRYINILYGMLGTFFHRHVTCTYI